MFKKASVGVVALTYLSEDVKALKTKYRPPAGSNPWHKEVKSNTWVAPDWDVNYFVPDFGVDNDVLNTQKHLADSEGKLGHKLFATFKKSEGHPVDYFVPNFGADQNDVRLTQSNIEEAEQELGHKFQADFKPAGPAPPKDYFVPNFGVDNDIKDNTQNLLNAEKKLDHKLWKDYKKPGPPPPRDYFVPNFGLDEDIVNVQAAIAGQEAIHGTWTPKQDENGVWIVPKAASEKSYSYKGDGQPAPATPPPPAKADFIPELGFLQLRDDPICSSADPDCGQPIPKSHPVNYFVPNFGEDEDIAFTKSNIRNAEWQLGHRLYQDWAPSAPPPRDYTVPNFGIDEDIANINQIIADQEKIHGKWTPIRDDNGVWIVPKAASASSYSYEGD